jgi:hypothetical protein
MMRIARNLGASFFHTSSKMAPIERITLFNIPNEADRDRVLEQYKVMTKTATKVCIDSSPVE